MIDLGTYKDRFAESGQRVLEHAVQESRRRDQNYIAVEHILNAIAVEEGELFNSTMRDLSLDPRSVKVMIEKRLENARYQNVNKGIRIAPETIELFKRDSRARERVVDGCREQRGVAATRDLGDDSAVFGVKRVLIRRDVAEHAHAVPHDRGRCVIARGLDTEKHAHLRRDR